MYLLKLVKKSQSKRIVLSKFYDLIIHLSEFDRAHPFVILIKFGNFYTTTHMEYAECFTARILPFLSIMRQV